MSKKYPGGYLTKTPPTVSQTSAPGIWTLEQAEYYQNAGLWPIPPDPYFNQVSLLLHGDGTNGSQNNTFLDSSTNNFTITRTGNVAQGTFSPFSLAAGYWSNYFDGSGDYLTVPASTALDFGTGDFTVEWWQYWNGTQSSYGTLYNNNYGSAPNLLIQTNANVNQYIVYMNGTSTTITESSAASANQWYHYAVVRNGTTVTIYRNGVSTGSTTYSGNVGSSVTTYIGTGGSGPYTITASYLSNFRIVKGTAVYTANFTPPTSALTAITNTSLLTCQSNRFKDNSSNNFTITPSGDTKVTAFSPFAPSAAYSASTNGGSGYFDGTGDYLDTPVSSSFAVGTGNFTAEAFTYLTALPGNNVNAQIFDYRFGGGGSGWQFAWRNESGILKVIVGEGGTVFTTITTSVVVGEWVHIAVVRNSSNGYVYINGVQVGSSFSWTSNYGSNLIRVGGYGAGANSITGYLTNARFTTSALYTANFTPPTAPLTAVANTQLLLNCTNAGIYDNAGKNDIETVGNAQISTSVKKYGTGSMAFDGNGDCLSIASNTALNLSLGDFTIEGYFYCITLTNNNQQLVNKDGVAGSSYPQYSIDIQSDGKFGCNIGSGNGTSYILSLYGTTTVTLNSWNHFALTKSGSTIRLFLNGVMIVSGTQTGSMTDGGKPLLLGYQTGQGSGQYFNGYIDELRITKGIARYTANFVPPNGPFPNV